MQTLSAHGIRGKEVEEVNSRVCLGGFLGGGAVDYWGNTVGVTTVAYRKDRI